MINKTNNGLFEKINKTDKTLTRNIKRQRLQITKTRNEKQEVTSDTREIQKIIQKYCE